DKRNLDVLAWYGVNDFLTFEKDMEDKLKDEMSAIGDVLRKRGFEVKLRIERGLPFKEILRVEEEEDVSLIVIGSHGKSNMKEMLLGSVSEKVVRKAKKPVLVVKR
ncbi:MAG: universal stress protein, partial [Candidatus Methanofastidiosia archaeon]